MGGRAVTMRDVARLAQVSPATVSNVLLGKPRVAESTRARVMAAADALDFRPNAHARSLRVGRTGSIGLILPGLRNAYFAEFASEVIEAARARSLAVSLDVLEEADIERERELLLRSSTSFVDGVIYYPSMLTGEQIDRAVPSGLPVVLVGERGVGSLLDQVHYRNADAAEAVTRHLLDSGARRILAIGPHEFQGSAPSRLDGYLRAHRRAGVALVPELVVSSPRWHRQDGAAAVRSCLAAGLSFDAVFGFNDMLALGAMRALAEAGFQVPRDLKVAGFDDLEEAAFAFPALTTADPGKQQAATLAVELLASRIADGAGRRRVLECDYRMVVRSSSH